MVKTIELSTASQPLADYAEDFRDKTVVFTFSMEGTKENELLEIATTSN